MKILIFLIIPQFVFSSVTAKVDYKTVEIGEIVTYSLNVSGEDVKRPNIQKMCETDVISTSSQTSMQIINSNVTKNYIFSYQFLPQKSCKIDPVEVEVDGKKETSNEVNVEVKPISETKDREFILELASSKKSVYVGESFEVTLLFKQKKDARAVDSKFVAPEFKGFWIKSESKPTNEIDGEYSVTKMTYKLSAQRSGKLNITKAQMRIASRVNRFDSWGSFMPSVKWKTYFSNELKIDVKELPNGVEYVGDFSISLTADKKEISVNEAVNIKISVNGNGNLEDIKSFKPYIDGVSVFDEKIDIKDGALTQNIAFVSDKDFTIPSFKLKYLDLKSKKVKTISTDSLNIKVKNKKSDVELNIKRDDALVIEKKDVNEKEFNNIELIFIFILGVIIGVLLMSAKGFKFRSKDKKVSLNNPKNLLVKLLPYKDDKEVKKIIDLLEDSIYSSNKLEIDKKILKDILKRYQID